MWSGGDLHGGSAHDFIVVADVGIDVDQRGARSIYRNLQLFTLALGGTPEHALIGHEKGDFENVFGIGGKLVLDDGAAA